MVLGAEFNDRIERVMHSTIGSGIARALYAAPLTSRVWRFFMTFYGERASHLGVYSKGALIMRFINDDGVRQGCPLAAFLYALSVQHIYLAAVRDIPDVTAVAIADDFCITGPSRSVARALRQLATACEEDGPNLNFGKCRALWPYSRDHINYPEFVAAMSSYAVPIPIHHHSIPLLGSSVGLGMSRADHCIAAAKEHHHLFNAISHADMPVQCALLLLRLSGVPRFSYLTRVTPPAIIRQACEIFDALIMRSVTDKTNLPDPATNLVVRRAVTLPFRSSGMGFLPHTRSSPAAWYSSMTASARHVAAGRTDSEMRDCLAHTDTAAHLADTHAVLVGSGVDPAAETNQLRFPLHSGDF